MTPINPNIINCSESLKALGPLLFLGVNGSGMRPLAELCRALGATVSGVDRGPASPSIDVYLDEGDVACPELVDRNSCLVISTAIQLHHPLLARGTSKGKKILHRSDLLAIICSHFETIAVAGTHGKSTTSALITHLLNQSHDPPSAVLGAPFSSGETSSWRLGSSRFLVVEADESDGTFLKYPKTISVVTNIESDHLDFYKNDANLIDAFRRFALATPKNGCLIYCADHVPDNFPGVGSQNFDTVSYGESISANIRLIGCVADGLSTSISFEFSGVSYAAKIPLPGKHNALNCLAAISAGIRSGLEVETCLAALMTFPGLKRRLQRYHSQDGRLIFDDYAHNPGKISNCLSGLRAAYPSRRLIVIFQPHRFTRLTSLFQQFAKSFGVSNCAVVVVPVYAAGEPEISGCDGPTIARAISEQSGVRTFSAATLSQASELVKSMLNPENDVVVTVGAGDVWLIAKHLAEQT